MEYHGKLYGKIGNKYFDTGKSSADFDKLKSDNTAVIEKLEAEKKELLEALESVSKSLEEFWNEEDCDITIFDILDTPKLDSLIQKHKQ